MPRSNLSQASTVPDPLAEDGPAFDEDYEPETNYDDADSLLGAPVPGVSFLTLGHTVKGTILDVTTADQRDPDGKVKTFASGQVRRQVILTLQTMEHENEDDDGRRRLFIKSGMAKAFRAAIKESGARGPRPGGVVTVTYTENARPSTKGMNPMKLFKVTYKPPEVIEDS